MAKQQTARRLLAGWVKAERGRGSLLAERLGVHRQAVNNWTKGRSAPMSIAVREAIETETGGVVPADRWPPTREQREARRLEGRAA